MPIERELKYVLKWTPELAHDLRVAASAEKKPVGGTVYAYSIDQGYLQKGSRVRRLNPVFLTGIPSGVAEPRCRFTYKQKLKDRPGLLEIECDIEESDFNLAWSEAERKLYKVRVVLPMGNFVFEIDHFYENSASVSNGDEPYLVLCELELPYTGTDFAYKPEDVSLHPIIEKYLLFAVPEGDDRFSNRKLGDRHYVTKVLSEVTSGKAK